ncbi:MAG: hypothetical protein ACRDJJ_07825 [Actinomycetota bacterium]
MAVKGAIESRIPLPRRRGRQVPVPTVELWPGMLGAVRIALANVRARKALSGATELAGPRTRHGSTRLRVSCSCWRV